MNGIQLHNPLRKGARIPWVVSMDGSVTFKSASQMPFIYWPNGKLCFEGTAYLAFYLRNKKSSLNLTGGSLRQYAFQISELLRFVFQNKINILEVTDSYFEFFIEGLMVPLNSKGQQKRSPNRVRVIGSRCLAFMSFVGKYFGFPDFVSENGSVSGVEVDEKLREYLGKKVKGLVWYHRALPAPSTRGERYPIEDDQVKALNKAAAKQSGEKRKRSRIMLSALENLGGRRDEVAHLLVMDILRAFSLNETHPLVRLMTVKGDYRTYRYVPVPRAVVSSWVQYIKMSRVQIIERTVGAASDEGYLFVNLYTGRQLSVNTITNEINDLRGLAAIKEPAHAHLFRHRFITRMLAMLMVKYDLRNSDELRKALLGSSAIRQTLQQWSGHRLPSSLDTYIDHAFVVAAKLRPVIIDVLEDRSKEFILNQIEIMEADLAAQLITEEEYHATLKDLWQAEVDQVKRGQHERGE
jgi:integrase